MNKKLKSLLSGLTEQVGLVEFYIEESNKLEKKDTSFIICDLDDTLFAREEQIEKEPELQTRRGYEGNKYMVNYIGINEMISRHYENKKYPKDILDTLDYENTLILTAGIPEYQMKKQEALGLQDFSIKIVWEGKDKVLETIRYILFELKYIPSKITVYEDRPQFFIEYRTLIEGCLGTKLEINFVEMDGNSGYKKIEEV